MANTFHTVCKTVLIFLFLFAAVKCSEIKFTSNETSRPDELTMRCSLNKASPKEMNQIKAIVITTPSGENLAFINTDKPLTLVDNTTEGVQVTGQLLQSGQEMGFLQVVWKHPVSALNGKYNCFIYANGKNFHYKKLVKSVTVQIEKVKYDDLVESVRQLKMVIDKQEESVRQLKMVNDKQRKSRVMFTASLAKFKIFKSNTDIVFDKVITNIGGGYNKSSGVFTCPVDGFYLFQIHLLLTGIKPQDCVYIKVNNKNVGFAHGTTEMSSGVTVQLKSGDKVHVVKCTDRILNHSSDEPYSYFSGYLLALN